MKHSIQRVVNDSDYDDGSILVSCIVKAHYSYAEIWTTGTQIMTIPSLGVEKLIEYSRMSCLYHTVN